MKRSRKFVGWGWDMHQIRIQSNPKRIIKLGGVAEDYSKRRRIRMGSKNLTPFHTLLFFFFFFPFRSLKPIQPPPWYWILHKLKKKKKDTTMVLGLGRCKIVFVLINQSIIKHSYLCLGYYESLNNWIEIVSVCARKKEDAKFGVIFGGPQPTPAIFCCCQSIPTFGRCCNLQLVNGDQITQLRQS